MHNVKSVSGAISKLKKSVEKKGQNSYYVEVSLALRIDSDLDYAEIQEMFNENGADAKVYLKSGDKKIESETLEVWSLDWEEWERL